MLLFDKHPGTNDPESLKILNLYAMKLYQPPGCTNVSAEDMILIEKFRNITNS